MHASLESILWIGITLTTFSLNIPVVNDMFKMIASCSYISSLSSLRIFIGMLFGPADLLGLKFEIIYIMSSFVQGEVRN